MAYILNESAISVINKESSAAPTLLTHMYLRARHFVFCSKTQNPSMHLEIGVLFILAAEKMGILLEGGML